MKGAVLYGRRDVRFKERSTPKSLSRRTPLSGQPQPAYVVLICEYCGLRRSAVLLGFRFGPRAVIQAIGQAVKEQLFRLRGANARNFAPVTHGAHGTRRRALQHVTCRGSLPAYAPEN